MKTANLVIAIVYTAFLGFIMMAGMAEGDMEIVFGTFLFSGSVIMNWFSWNYLNKQDKRHAPKETH